MTLTQDQIDSFNQYQSAGFMHPFTCGTKGKHTWGDPDELVAKEDGLYCPSCDYRQDWAPVWMLDWSWKTAANQMFGIFQTP